MNEKLQQSPPSPESVRNKIDELLVEARERIDAIDFHEKMFVLAQRIKEKYPDYIKYRAYHRLIGSTPRESSELTEDDFEGDCSVISFLEGLLNPEENKNVAQ